MKFSVVTTVLNEEESILPLLNSLNGQSLQPDEVIVVDAGSTDKTVATIRTWQKDHDRLTVRLIEREGVNRSAGRNLGIQAAANEHIAVIDAGCEADGGWLEAFARKWQKYPEVESVAGFYLVHARNIMEYCFGLMLAVSPSAFDKKTYLPSSRSVSFTKKTWETVGKYPEYLDTCEDLVFARDLKKKTAMKVTKKALVYWYMPKDLKAFIKQVRGYAYGDVKARYRPHLLKVGSVWLRYLVFVLYPPLLMLYLIYAPIKHWKAAWRNGAFFLLPAVQLAADVGVMWGSLLALRK